MQLRLIFVLPIFFLLFSSLGKAQTTFNVAGNSATIQGVTYEYSIGEMSVVSTNHSPNLIVTQGILQPLQKQASQPSELSKSLLTEAINVYPNPTENFLFIETKDFYEGELTYTILDATGKVISNGTCSNQQKQRVDLSSQSNGIYFLQVTSLGNKPETLSYKIQKIK